MLMLRLLPALFPAKAAPTPRVQALLQQKRTAAKGQKRYPKSVCTSLKDLCEL